MINTEGGWDDNDLQYATRPNADPFVEVSSGENYGGIFATELECHWGQILHCRLRNL